MKIKLQLLGREVKNKGIMTQDTAGEPFVSVRDALLKGLAEDSAYSPLIQEKPEKNQV